MAEEYWIGWLIDNLGHRNEEIFAHLEQAIHNRNIPKWGHRDRDDTVSVSTDNVNMWWRRDSKQLTVTSEVDGTAVAKIISQDYGTSLWVAVMLERNTDTGIDNWAKAMSGTAFNMTIRRVINEAIIEVAGDNTITDVPDPRTSNG